MLFALRDNNIFIIYEVINVLINNSILTRELFDEYFSYDKKKVIYIL